MLKEVYSFMCFEKCFNRLEVSLRERRNTNPAYTGRVSRRIEEASSYFMSGIPLNLKIFNIFRNNPIAELIML